MVGVLLALDRTGRLPRGRLFAAYVALYTAGRAWIEALCIDPAPRVAGMRLNVWTSVVLFIAASIVIAASLRGRREAREP